MRPLHQLIAFALTATLLSLTLSAPPVRPAQSTSTDPSAARRFLSILHRQHNPAAHLPKSVLRSIFANQHPPHVHTTARARRSTSLSKPLLQAFAKRHAYFSHHPLKTPQSARSSKSSPYTQSLSPVSHQLTYDPCLDSADCLGTRECVQSDGTNVIPCDRTGLCVCRPGFRTTCQSTEECMLECTSTCIGNVCNTDCNVVNEVCVALGTDVQTCVSAEAAENDPDLFPIIPDNTGGLTGDPCTIILDCQGSRLCVSLQDTETICAGEDNCVCFPLFEPEPCTGDSECVTGEVCVPVGTEDIPICVSAAVAPSTSSPTTAQPSTSTTTTTSSSSTTTTEPTTSTTGTSPPSTTTSTSAITSAADGTTTTETDTASGTEIPLVTGTGLTGDRCQEAVDCIGERSCFVVDLDGSDFVDPEVCPGEGERCACLPDNFITCEGSSECQEGEICGSVIDNIGGEQFCFSEIAVQNEDVLVAVPDVPSEICIDAEALNHMPLGDLVFAKHAPGRVLCDKEGSCATRGHMVVYQGKVMMMGTYCELVGCKRRIMYVNSPKYSRNKRVKSRTKGLEYTVFAARWETKTEESILSAAVRIGL